MSAQQGQPKPPSPRSVIVTGLALLALGIPLLLFGIYFLLLGDVSKTWPTVQGVIVTNGVRLDSDSSRRLPRKGVDRNKRRHVVQITYRYEVDGESYRSSRFSFGDGQTAARAKNRDQALALAADRFPAGKEIEVFYNPEQPKESVLASGINWGTAVPSILGLLFSLSGVGVAVLGIRQRSQVDV